MCRSIIDIIIDFKSDVQMVSRHRLITDVKTFLSFTTPTKTSVEILFYIGAGPMSDDIILVVIQLYNLESQSVHHTSTPWTISLDNESHNARQL